MASTTKLKDKYEVSSKCEPFFTGGKVEWSEDGSRMICQCSETVKVVTVETGETVLSVGEDDEIVTFALSSARDTSTLITSHRSTLFRQWNWKEGTVGRTWKSVHRSAALVLDLSPDGHLLASAGSDSMINVWDLTNQRLIQSLKEGHGMFSLLKFHPENEKQELLTVSDNYNIERWNLGAGRCTVALKGHNSTVTAIEFLFGGHERLVSCGRDQVVIVWDLETNVAVQTIPVFEELEGLIVLPERVAYPELNVDDKGTHIVTAGSRGVLRVWKLDKGKEVFVQQNSLVTKPAEEGSLAITQLSYIPSQQMIGIVTSDHNIITHRLSDFELLKQLVGYNGEILDVVIVGEEENLLAVATNSTAIRLYEAQTFSCELLRGHSDLVLSLATCSVNRNVLASGSKDNTIRLWIIDGKKGKAECVFVGEGHSASVGALSFSHVALSFLVSAAQENTIKLWHVGMNEDQGVKTYSLQVKRTSIAHDKDVNSVAVSPNDKIVATASQDKTAKLWKADTLSLIGVIEGHRRGVWCVCFSPVDQALATSSADGTIKLWALSDLSCIKTFEANDSGSVLGLKFLSHGMQILSVFSDGLMMLWNVKSGECTATMESHDDKIWGLAVDQKETRLVTGGADSLLLIWKDVTEERKAEEMQKMQKKKLEEQRLENLIHHQQYSEALALALGLHQPHRTLNIIQEIVKQDSEGLGPAVASLGKEERNQLFEYVVTWNTNSRQCHYAQVILNIFLRQCTPEELFAINGFEKHLTGLRPYAERHYQRLSRLLHSLSIVNFLDEARNPACANVDF